MQLFPDGTETLKFPLLSLTALQISSIALGDYKDVDFLLEFTDDSGRPIEMAIRTQNLSEKTKWVEELLAQQKLSMSTQSASKELIEEVLGYARELKAKVSLSAEEQKLLRAACLVEVLISHPVAISPVEEGVLFSDTAASSPRSNSKSSLNVTMRNSSSSLRRGSAPFPLSKALAKDRRLSDSLVASHFLSRQGSVNSQSSFRSTRTHSSSGSMDSFSQFPTTDLQAPSIASASFSKSSSFSTASKTTPAAKPAISVDSPKRQPSQLSQQQSRMQTLQPAGLSAPAHHGSQLSLHSSCSDDGDDMQGFLEHFLGPASGTPSLPPRLTNPVPVLHKTDPRKFSSQPSIVVVPPELFDDSPTSSSPNTLPRSRANSFRAQLLRNVGRADPPHTASGSSQASLDSTPSSPVLQRSRVGSFRNVQVAKVLAGKSEAGASPPVTSHSTV